MQSGGYFRSEGRFIAQIILLLITFCIVSLAFNYIKKINDVAKYLKVYLYALIVLVALGWVQYFIYGFTNIDIFPLGTAEDGNIRSGMYMHLFRMSSLGGEPKSFSLSLIIGFFIIHIFNRNNIKFFKQDILIKYLFLFTAFATLSTSGMVLFVILFFIYSLCAPFIVKQKMSKKNMIYSIIVVSLIGFLVFHYWHFISSIVEQRIFDRDIANEDYDAPIKIFLGLFPQYLLFGSGLGNIHNLAAPYIPAEYMHYMANTIFVAKSGYLKIISELGFVGLFLFLMMFYSVYGKMNKLKKKLKKIDKNYFSAMQLLLVLIVLGYFARIYLAGELVLFLALANVLVYSKSIRKDVFHEN